MENLLVALIVILTLLGIVSVSAFLIYVRKVKELYGPRPAVLSNSAAQPEPELPSRPLQGLRIAIDITQDHPHSVFIDLLKEQLFAEDVTDIIISTDAEIWTQENPPDILIKGNVVSNGYAEIYYEAEFTCSNRNESICTLIEKPPHGDRPNNLAIELIARLKKELEKIVNRNERRAALKELKS